MSMAKVARNGSTGRFTVASAANGKRTTIRDEGTGKSLPLKGYGALRGKFVVRDGMNLSKPIAEQAAKSAKSSPSARKS
jgi:hypothetical protein